MLRIDIVERIARQLHDARDASKRAETAFEPDAAFATSVGLDSAGFARLLAELGFRRGKAGWSWRGHRPPAVDKQTRDVNHAFAILAELRPGRV